MALPSNLKIHPGTSDGIQGSCKGVGGGPATILLLADRPAQTIGDSVAHASYNALALMYAMGQLGPFGPRAEPPPKPTPKPTVAPASTPLRDRKAELRRIQAKKARAKRLVKRLRSKKPQVIKFSDAHGASMTINGEEFPIRGFTLTIDPNANNDMPYCYGRSRSPRELLGGIDRLQ